MKMNAKLILGVCLAIGLAIAVVGCGSSAPHVYDPSVPTDQSSTLKIFQCQVTRFDGKAVDLKWNGSAGEKTIVIPSGSHTLNVWSSAVSSTSSGLTQETGAVSMEYNFLPGRTYFLMSWVNNGKVDGRIIDATALNNDLVPNPESPDATPFEGKWVDPNTATHYLLFANNECIVSHWLTLRGFFTYTENSIKVDYLFMYNGKSKQWHPYASDSSNTEVIPYNGTVFTHNKAELKKE